MHRNHLHITVAVLQTLNRLRCKIVLFLLLSKLMDAAGTQKTHYISVIKTKPFANWVILHDFCRMLNFSKSTFLKNSLRNSIIMLNSLDPDEARHFVGPDLCPNSLQRLSADGTSIGKELNFTALHDLSCLLSLQQMVWTQIRLLHTEQSDLGQYCSHAS